MQAATHRVMAKHSKMLIHEVRYLDSVGYYDSAVSLHEDELDEARRVQKVGNKILASRSNVTLAEIEERTYKRDWWLTAQDCLKLGFCDEVR
jgi:ATP-dependent protease ClpP protease subunit